MHSEYGLAWREVGNICNCIALCNLSRAMWPPDSHSDEFIKNLGTVAIFLFKDGNLFLDLKAGGGTMEFAPGVL
jgi:hypothetical protein